MNRGYRKLSPLAQAAFRPLRMLMARLFPVTLVKWQYRFITRHHLNLNHPVRYTEKLQYLRLFVYPHDKLVAQCADRAGVRQYLEERDLGRYLIPSYGVFDTFEAIDLDRLPNSFVLKCTHACALNAIVKDKDAMDVPYWTKRFRQWLKTDYGLMTIERHYSRITPRIIVEKYLGNIQSLPIEYKIHVYNGKARNLYVVTGRGHDIRYTNFYIDWTPFDGSQFNGWRKADEPIERPANFDEMIALAERLGAPFPFVRVDLYNIDGKIFFSEMTFTPAKGTLILDDDRTDFEIGSWLDISTSMKGSKR